MLTVRIRAWLLEVGNGGKNVDFVSQRRNSTYVNLDLNSLNDLNDLMNDLNDSDDSYVPPSDVVIGPDVEIPQVTVGKFGTFSQNLREPPLEQMKCPIGFGRIPPSF